MLTGLHGPSGEQAEGGSPFRAILAGLTGSQRHQEGDYQVVEATKGSPEVGSDVAGRRGGPRRGHCLPWALGQDRSTTRAPGQSM